MKSTLRIACVFLLLCTSACAPYGHVRPDQYKYVKPRVAILDFENKVSLSNHWKLSEGMRDMLVDALVKTDSYTVLTRNDLGAVLSELDIQTRPHFRREGKLQQGKLKNVQYLIKGAVTDFAHVRGGALRAAASGLGLGISGDVAVVSLTLYVIDVESGEVIASKTMEGTASAGSVDFSAAYRDVAIGGKSFYRTPLGKATQEVMDQCLEHIAQVIATQRWYPSVVKVNGSQLIISGGADRRMAPGSRWAAYEKGEPLIDPNTGDILGQEPGKYSGRIRVTEVLDKYSTAEIIEGVFREGQNLRPDPQLP
ncbi:MAG TPA: CsgG/HfaB family protein [Verrucomicrobiae bacterium]|nr:CsgG/HfaB family protein [Verrucomicrobiae bacterium]